MERVGYPALPLPSVHFILSPQPSWCYRTPQGILKLGLAFKNDFFIFLPVCPSFRAGNEVKASPPKVEDPNISGLHGNPTFISIDYTQLQEPTQDL